MLALLGQKPSLCYLCRDLCDFQMTFVYISKHCLAPLCIWSAWTGWLLQPKKNECLASEGKHFQTSSHVAPRRGESAEERVGCEPDSLRQPKESHLESPCKTKDGCKQRQVRSRNLGMGLPFFSFVHSRDIFHSVPQNRRPEMHGPLSRDAKAGWMAEHRTRAITHFSSRGREIRLPQNGMIISGHAKSLAEGLFWMLIFKAVVSWSYLLVPGKTITHSWHMAPDGSLPRCHLTRVPFKHESESRRVTGCHFQHTGGTEGYYAKWEKPGPDSRVPHDLTHTCHLE